MNIIDDDTCTFCQNQSETLFCLFCDCPIIKQLWLQVQNYVKEKCKVDFHNWLATNILFGITRLDIVYNKIILIAKSHILQ
jgi:hypothetical protein